MPEIKLKIGGAKQANADSDPKHYLMNRFKVIVQIYLFSTYIHINAQNVQK